MDEEFLKGIHFLGRFEGQPPPEWTGIKDEDISAALLDEYLQRVIDTESCSIEDLGRAADNSVLLKTQRKGELERLVREGVSLNEIGAIRRVVQHETAFIESILLAGMAELDRDDTQGLSKTLQIQIRRFNQRFDLVMSCGDSLDLFRELDRLLPTT